MKNMRRVTLMLIGALLLGGCRALPSSFQLGDQSMIVHSPSQWKFPERIAGFERAQVLKYDAVGNDCSVAYNLQNQIAATVYVYPVAGQSLASHMRDVTGAIERMHYSGPARVKTKALFRGRRGLRAGYVYEQVFAYRPQFVRSQVLLFKIDDRFLKFRISYPDGEAQALEKKVDQFFDEFPWP